MSKLLKKDHSPLKFDTSLANLNCFIRTKSKPKPPDPDYHPRLHKAKRKPRNQLQKHIEFQDKAFLQSVVCKILTDADCQGITELIENMVFPSGSSVEAQGEGVKESRKQQLEQEEISHIFSDFQPFNRPHYPHPLPLYDQQSELYRLVQPPTTCSREEKQERNTTVHSSMNSFCVSPREGETNPQIELLSINQVMPLGYGYNYYPQPGCLYPRQVSQRKRRTVSGQEAFQYRIIPDRIEADGRTTLMIRHIPNKYSQEMLLEEIGKNHRLHINFLYLPIDHFNACNVGYAFANFIHTKFILEFYREFNGRRWDRFNSEKICELAYARIQGTTNLMDHFQNSNGQVRGRALGGKCEERKKSSVQLDDDAIKDINKILDHQRVEDN